MYGHSVKLGSEDWIGSLSNSSSLLKIDKSNKYFASRVYVLIDEELMGYFELLNSYREVV